MMDNKTPTDPYAVFKIKDYRFFLAARFAVVLGVQVQGVAVGWQVYELTKDPLSLGLVGLSEAIPALSVALYAGYVVDRTNRKTLLMVSLVALLCCALALLGFAYFPSVTEIFGALAIYVVVFLSGLARGFLSPAMFSLAAQIVPRTLYANMASWNSASFETASILGPALGGLIYGTLGAQGAYTLDVALMALSIVALAGVLSPRT
ncbi:MAG: MFS transporter, partial [Candidatus Thermochlorobacter sp.]